MYFKPMFTLVPHDFVIIVIVQIVDILKIFLKYLHLLFPFNSSLCFSFVLNGILPRLLSLQFHFHCWYTDLSLCQFINNKTPSIVSFLKMLSFSLISNVQISSSLELCCSSKHRVS